MIFYYSEIMKNKGNISFINMNESHLDIPLVDNIDYTRRDEIVFGLMDVIKCPILLDTSERMVIFNDWLYDREAFEHHRNNENQRNM